MLKFAANIITMFDERDELERLGHAAKLGFKHVEWLFLFSRPEHEIDAKLNELDLNLVLINAALGDPRLGDRGIGAVPGREDEFRQAMQQAIDYASMLNVPMIHVMAGQCSDPTLREHYLDTFANNLVWVVAQLESQSIQLLLEPLNRYDTPHYLIGTTSDALDVIRPTIVGIRLQFDFYHAQIMEGDLGRTLREHIGDIAHIQFSSVPGRHEPQYGEVNCDYLFNLLESLSYSGYIGCEYRPKTTVDEGMSWVEPYGLGGTISQLDSAVIWVGLDALENRFRLRHLYRASRTTFSGAQTNHSSFASRDPAGKLMLLA